MTRTQFHSSAAASVLSLLIACGGGGSDPEAAPIEPEQPAVYATAQDLSDSARYCNRVNAEGKYCNVWNRDGRYVAAEGPVCFERTMCLAPTGSPT